MASASPSYHKNELASLDEVLHDNGDTRTQLAINLLFHATQALSALHSAGTVHGDLRCANILVTHDRQAVQLGGLDHSFDWNSLRFRLIGDKTPQELGISVSNATRWLAPECVAGAVPSPASDVYALGMTLYEALTGEPPFANLDDDAVIELKKMKETQLPDRAGDKIDRETWSLIQDACHHNPIFRPSVQIITMTMRTIRSSALAATTSASGAARGSVESKPVSSGTAKSGVVTPQVAAYASAAHMSIPRHTLELGSSPRSTTTIPAPPAKHTIPPNGVNMSTSTAWQPPDSKVQPVNMAAAVLNGVPPVSNVSGGLGSKKAATPLWKRLMTVVVVVAIAVSIAVPLATRSGSSSQSVGGNSPSGAGSTPSPTPSSSSTVSTHSPVSPTSQPSVTTLRYSISSNPISAITVADNGEVYTASGGVIYRLARDDQGSSSIAAGSTFGYQNGVAEYARFSYIGGLAFTPDGDLLISDGGNKMLRKLVFSTSSDYVISVAGPGASSAGWDGPRIEASWPGLSGIAIDSALNVFVAINALGDVQMVSLTHGTVSSVYDHATYVISVAVHPKNDDIYFTMGSRITRVAADRSFYGTVAGGTENGYKDAVGTDARFNVAMGIAFSPSGDDLYITDMLNTCIRKLNIATSEVTTVAGQCTKSGRTDGSPLTALFSQPMFIAVGPNGMIYVADYDRVRSIKL